jgi:hypothetical protein
VSGQKVLLGCFMTAVSANPLTALTEKVRFMRQKSGIKCR